MDNIFANRETIEQVEEGTQLAPKFDSNGLIPVVTTDFGDGTVLMLGYMNNASLTKTIETRQAHYFSRSRQAIWRKGETSGLTHNIRQILIDDDQDAIWLKVVVGGSGASCHVGYRSCFYREIPEDQSKQHLELKFVEQNKIFDAEATYAGLPNPTKL